MYLTSDWLRGIWGLEDRAYTEQEVKASPHLQAAVAAGALVASGEREPSKAKPITRAADSPQRAEHKED